MSDHFTLDVDLESLRAAQRWLNSFAPHMRTEGRKIGNTPEALGTSWTGPAATKIKGEMESLGTTVTGFESKLTTLHTAVKTFADAVETFQNTTLPKYNKRWSDAETKASEDMKQAEKEAKEKGQDPEVARGQVANGLRYTMMGISHDFGEERDALATKAKALGTALGSSSPVHVPDSVATRFVNGGGSGTNLSWTDSDGSFPPDLDANAKLDGTGLSEDVDQQEAGKKLADQVNSGDLTPDEAAALAKQMNPDSEAFRSAFINQLDPEKLAEFHRFASETGAREGSEKWGELLTAIGTVLSKGSRRENQTTYPVDGTQYDKIVEAYTSMEDEYDPTVKDRGYLMLAELVAAGQGQPPTWDSDFLADVTRKTIAHEREQVKLDPYWNWSSAVLGPGHRMTFLTEKGREWYGGAKETTNPAWADPLVLYFEAMGDDTTAAQQVFTNGGSALDQDLSHYLYDRKAGHAGNYGWALSELLQSATEPVGAGNAGDQNYVSAAVVADMVDWYADHPVGLNMDQGIVNILANHAHALNHAGSDYEGLVIEDNPQGVLPSEKILLANLDDADVKKLLTQVLGLDYYSNKLAEEKDPNSHSFPLYSKLALAMELAAKQEVQVAAVDGGSGLLETTVNNLSAAQERTLQSFQDALQAQGRDGDEATQDAKAALSFVTGIAKSYVPTSKLGEADVLAGPMLDKVESLLVDTLIPDTQYEAAAIEDGDTQTYRRKLTSLKLVEWLADAGVAPPAADPVAWAGKNPEFSSFVRDGELIPPDELYRNRKTNPDAWNDFIKYYENAGRPWLAELDLDEQYKLGWLEAGG